MTYVILNHALIPAENATISVQDRGFRFGDGIFDTLRVEGGVPYRFRWHMQRLEAALAAVRIVFDLAPLMPLCQQLLKANTLSRGLLRIQITRGAGSKGYLPTSEKPTLLMETLPLPPAPKPHNRVWLSHYQKISPAALPIQHKLTQGLSSTLVRLEAHDKGCLDGLMLNAKGELCETSSGNLFWLKEGRIFTPRLECGALNGGMRAAFIERSPVPVAEVAAPLAELQSAEAVWVCNVAWGLAPVSALEPTGWQWDSQPKIAPLQKRMHDDILREASQFKQQWQQAA